MALRFLQALPSSPETSREAVDQRILAVEMSDCKWPRTKLSGRSKSVTKSTREGNLCDLDEQRI